MRPKRGRRRGRPPAPNVNGTPPSDAGQAPAPALTLVGWLMSNGPYLFFMLLLAGWLYQKHGLDGLVRASMVVVGLGFVIFIHELGHFLAAKWCDVHVQTFSIGFGPALPGCSSAHGETTYKLAVLPLGGYVNMVGEGPEADEDEDYPRSFKNKTVGQRMLIISAGVIMNVLFGAACFVIVYRYHGVERPPAVVWTVESGSRAWKEGVRAGWKIVRIDDKKDPWFDDMKVKVALSGERPIDFEFKDRKGNLFEKSIEPLRDANNMMPVIGVSYTKQLRLFPSEFRKIHSLPVRYNSAAASARVMDLGKGDVVLEATDPDKGKVLPLPSGEKGWAELCERMRKAGSEPMTLKVRRAGKKAEETVSVPAVGFDFNDLIVGTTDPATPDQPFNVALLPLDPSRHPLNKKIADPFAFRERQVLLAGLPMVVQVYRGARRVLPGTEETDDSPPVNILVPAAYHKTLGLRMKMGKIAAIREESPAAAAGLKPGEVIKGVRLIYDKEKPQDLDEAALDPVRLPDELYQRIQRDPKRRDLAKWRVVLTVEGTVNHDGQAKRTLGPMTWDGTWMPDEEGPVSPPAPTSIPQLGVAYWVDSLIDKVAANSPADKAGLKPGDEIRELRLREPGKTPDEESWSRWAEMYSIRPTNPKSYDQWAYYFDAIQHNDFPIIKVKIAHGGVNLSQEFGPIEAEPDRTWPMPSRGLRLLQDSRLQKAHSLGEAVEFGMDRTMGFIKQIYLNLSSLVSGRISTKSLGGPLEIASQAFGFAGEDLFVFALFLGIISINLAVVNFLPIPVLDGGHMVFLIYEKLRGRPPSEMVRAVATYVGLFLIFSLMLYVFYQDLTRIGWLDWMK